ncbi:MAG: hypothetical protein IPL74_02720 [Bacteroidetes bacterium]|nr:hypothetical protein [Bacteroidota bacterium]
MQLITNNPYRIVGLLVGATAKEKERQIKRLKKYLEAGQTPETDFSFPSLGNLARTEEQVDDAASKLNLDKDKMAAAIFWFYNGNKITDEPALESLKETNNENGSAIWVKLTSSGEVNQKNCSAFQNLSTLLIHEALKGSKVNSTKLEEGISMKLKFLESEFIEDFRALATDETFKTSKNELQLTFLNQIRDEISEREGLSAAQFLDIINKQTFSAKADFLNSLIQKPIEKIESLIKETKKKRKENPLHSITHGSYLYNSSLSELALLKSVLGVSNLKYSSISDKVAEEVLQCGITYFSEYKDSKTNPANASMDLFIKAKSLAIGNIAKQRCQENTENLQEWINNKPERDKQNLISADLMFINKKLEDFQDLPDTISNTNEFLSSCKPKLINIKIALGFNDDLYLKVSSAVVNNAQGMLITVVNEAQENFKLNYNIIHLNKIVSDAILITSSLSTFDMLPDLKIHFTRNREALTNLQNQINRASTSSRQSSSSGTGGGCYIATMAYGSYEHPQVIVLRTYRDNYLLKSFWGRYFVKIYYHYSPMLVRKLYNHKKINSIIRNILDQLIKHIAK